VTSAEKVVFITGVSSGFGKACFDRFSKPGYLVVGTIRKGKAGGDGARAVVKMDVRDDESVRKAVRTAVDTCGGIDVLINNAGISVVGSLEDTSVEEAQLLFDTNFWGSLRLIKAVLPVMRERGGGHIINIGSLGGIVALPFQGVYSASKYAMEGMTAALSMEVKPFGIKVTVIEPGDFHTAITKNRIVAERARNNSPYAAGFEKALAVFVKGETEGENPERLAALIEKVIRAKNPRLRYRIGKKRELLAVSLSALLPDRLFERMTMDHFGS
jgi:NAD(P)-dependent dehydrogenase (short-subunit alcohol dehydrogenase family)